MYQTDWREGNIDPIAQRSMSISHSSGAQEMEIILCTFCKIISQFSKSREIFPSRYNFTKTPDFSHLMSVFPLEEDTFAPGCLSSERHILLGPKFGDLPNHKVVWRRWLFNKSWLLTCLSPVLLARLLGVIYMSGPWVNKAQRNKY